jgi:hypothetical protein
MPDRECPCDPIGSSGRLLFPKSREGNHSDTRERRIDMRRALLLTFAVLATGCGRDQGDHGTARVATRAEVVKIQVGSLPESPVLDWSPKRQHWSAVVVSLPAEFPAPPSGSSCGSGPTLIVDLRDGTELNFQCGLPSFARTTRDYVISLSNQ